MGVLELALAGGLALACLLLIVALLHLRSADRRHRAVLASLPQTAVAAFDHELRVVFAAGSSADFAGRTPEEIEGKFLLGHIPQAQREPLLLHYRAALRGEQRSFEYHSAQSGRDYWVRIVPLADHKGSITGGLSVALDISDRRQMDRDPTSRAAEVEAVTDATRALARSVDPAAARIAVCEGAREVAGAPVAALFEPQPGGSGLFPQACVGADLEGLELPLSGESGATLAFTRAEEIFVALGNGKAEADREFLRRAGARAVLWHPVVRDRAAIGVLAIAWREEVAGVSLRLSAMIDLLGAEAAVAIGRADLLGQLEHLARTDSLTGLPNRRHWEQQLPRELSRASRDGQKLCVAMLDLDHFKDYNDRRGHQAGDRLLAAGAISWRGALRPYDILARYGGEEFSVILPGCDLVDALTLVERLRSVTPEGESCSAGIAEWDGDEEAEALVGRADAALYRAKRSGRDQSIIANDNIHT
jgi:diguanylate cyclase (GGDEF)-like protein/PAS domain S-box-containing protein